MYHRLQSYHCIRTGVGISTSIGVEMADGVSLDSNSYALLLKRCTAAKALSRGKQIHAHIIKTGLQVNMFLWNILINMYAKCQSMPDARKMFDKMSEPDIVSWTAVIAGYAQQGHACEALKHFCQMQRGGPMPNEFTFGSVLKASAGIAAAEEGKQIHAHVFKAGLEREVFAGSALVDMYAKCQNMADARQVFDKMRKRDEVSWGAMICGYAQNGCSEEAVRIFYDMKGVGLTVNSFALSSVLRACSECKVSLLVRTSLTKTEKIMADSKPELFSTTLHRMESFKTRGVMARRGLRSHGEKRLERHHAQPRLRISRYNHFSQISLTAMQSSAPLLHFEGFVFHKIERKRARLGVEPRRARFGAVDKRRGRIRP